MIIKVFLIPLITISSRQLRKYNFINNNNTGSNNEKILLQYLSQLFSNPFPHTEFSDTSTQEIERIINSLQSKVHMGMKKSQQKHQK